MNALNLQNVKNDFYVPLCNLYYDEALKELKPAEFKTYITILYVIKAIGPNTKTYFSSKKDLHKNVLELIKVSEKTFLKHLKTFESRGLLNIEGKAIDLGFNVLDSKNGGYTPINILDLEYLILNLDNNELKLYLTIYRLTKGFNKKSSKLTYAQLKKWSGIKNKAIFIDTRNGLRDKNIIIALHDLETNTYQYKLKEFSNGFIFSTEDKKLHHVEKEHSKAEQTEEKKQYINKYIPKENKYLKKSLGNSQSFEKQKKFYQVQNKKKIFKFLNENIKTKYLSNEEKEKLFSDLLLELKTNGDFNGKEVKTTPDFYLSQEHPKYGRTIDKIIERYYYRFEEEKRANEGRALFFNFFKRFYPEEIIGLDDYPHNDISKHKFDLLIKSSPGAGYWSDDFIFIEEQVSNPEFSEKYVEESQAYMNKLMSKRVGGKEISFDERLELIAELIPEVEEIYPAISEFEYTSRKLPFSEFRQRYKEQLESEKYYECL